MRYFARSPWELISRLGGIPVRRLVLLAVLAAGLLPAMAQAAAPAAAGGQDEAKALTPAEVRQRQLADDTARLLVLANELKAEMDKSNKDMLSVAVMRKAEQVEKLARKVRDEMKTAN